MNLPLLEVDKELTMLTAKQSVGFFQ